ncbi:beta-ketoacyl-ACP synthase II [Marinicella sp. S1101]|uniref:beta-ketoacyl-ACP synthase II n=1 Tax=Marinicella marina TaxID=2996016 RepID=UPI002260F24E|nr:beta-ketoacyl-ACP synthase II [Marinicella marina]MCX7555031.1 beta-ketoacyl-ACP synthase II [Marinicella marina]MDJ1141305.1 beta-ketoacyl-ACP synthase II [Marinicella marina]
MTKRRVVVTGMGIISPVGNTLKTAWDNIVNGVSGIGPITHFDTSDFSAKIAGEIKDFDVKQYISAKEAKKMDPFIHYAMAAGEDAIADSGLTITEENAERVGVYIGAGIGGILGIQNTTETWLSKGPRRISPFFIPSTIINMASGNLSIKYGLKGPNLAMVSACTSATHSIGMAYRSIVYGDADVMVCGGAEYASTPIAIGGFSQSKALSTRNDDPTAASRPWDTERDGFVLGDGAGIMVIEDYEHALKRGAHIYAEISGFGMSSDAHHMTAPSPGGEGAARCMVNAINDSGFNASDFDYVNAHGTSTPQGDKGESDAVKVAFGDHAHKLAVSSTKSMTGHLLGAAGGIEAIFSVMALKDQILPPTINLNNPDPECDLDYVPNVARESKADVVISNSFGFGGTNGSLVFNRLQAK